MTLFYLYAFSFPGNKLHPRIKNSLIGLLCTAQPSSNAQRKQKRKEKLEQLPKMEIKLWMSMKKFF
jgi:hypothetical protein